MTKMTHELAENLAEQDAEWAIGQARQFGNYDPIVWITDNRYMPPLRDTPNGETVWQATDLYENEDGDYWTTYVETFEDVLDRANVYCGCPEYDNALYVVDLDRWQYKDDDVLGHNLQDEWEPVPAI